jgi:hypothetical protein
MPSPKHAEYQNFVRMWIRDHRDQPDVADTLRRHEQALLVLWNMDLEPARPILEACYAPNPRGGDPWDAIIMLRSFLLMLLVGQTSINKWPDDLEASQVLRVLVGIDPSTRERPGIGTHYDYLDRLHDGPIRRSCPHQEKPSELERRRARTPRCLLKRKWAEKAAGKKERRRVKKVERKRQALEKTAHEQQPSSREEAGESTPQEQTTPVAEAQDEPVAPVASTRQPRRKRGDKSKHAPVSEEETRLVTERLVAELEQAKGSPNPNDLLERLSRILMSVAVVESARRGLLGDITRLDIAGDGSPLRTGANRYGKRVCSHGWRERCNCPKLFTDPDAEWGWDSHREVWLFGHHFYEHSTHYGGHDLPLAIGLENARASDFTGSLKVWNRMAKRFDEYLPGWHARHAIQDAGHDAEPIYRYYMNQGTVPIIPLKSAARATHPCRPEVSLSKRGVPLCPAAAEMAHWGTAGKDRISFMCPVRANKLARCPLAPPDQPEWRCRPDLKHGMTLTLKLEQAPRLCPPVPRNSARWQEQYDTRSGCERSNSVKKETFDLEDAHHRRASFWLIRLHLIALLQHGKAWVAEAKASDLVDYLLGEEVIAQAAA